MRTTTKQASLDTIFRALSDPTRLRILNLLSGGEMCVCDIVGVLDVLQPAASRHLSYLRKAGLVSARRDEQWVYYRLSEPHSCFHEKLLECLACCSDQWSQLTKDDRRFRDLGGSSCGG
jgi:ArsR family transcriptional regulator, arsenate/arsenite/antimonite-responsive transcriptional repressor